MWRRNGNAANLAQFPDGPFRFRARFALVVNFVFLEFAGGALCTANGALLCGYGASCTTLTLVPSHLRVEFALRAFRAFG